MKKDIISMNDMAKEEIMEILRLAKKIENTPEEEKTFGVLAISIRLKTA